MKRKKKNKIKVFIIIILIILIGVLFGKLYLDSNKGEKTSLIKKTTTKKPEPVVQIVDEKSNTRPYAVMINNNKAVWGYQAGIEDSYITYEIIVEGGITRLMAVFKDKDTARIASVRSSRHYFLDYALENDAIYAHIGWSPQAMSDISKLGVNKINADNSGAFIWDKNLTRIAREHRAYTSIAALKEATTKLGYRTTSDSWKVLNFSAKPLDLASYEGATPANKVTIPFSTYQKTSFEYDAEAKVYKRFQNGIAHTDYITGSQYTAKNIITYKVTNYRLNDGSGKDRQGLNNIGSGEGYFISEGYAIPITWSKTSRTSKTIYKVKATGEDLVVNDGKTFIEIEPTIQNIVIE